MKKYILSLLGILIFTLGYSQDKYFTRNGHVSFYSDAPLEKIEAHNHKVASFLDAKTGEMVYTVLINAFQFKKALMQKHFNENFLESAKYPKASFKGKILNFEKVDLTKPGVQKVEVEGDLTIRGITKKINTSETLEVVDGNIIAKSKFPVAIADYNIKIPSVNAGKIAETVEVSLDLKYQPYKK